MLTWLKNTWNVLLETAVVISSFAASMLLPVVSGITVSETDPAGPIIKFATFIIAVLLGLSLIVTNRLNKRKHLGLWIILTVVFLGSSIYLVSSNFQLNNSLTCSCNGKSVVKGTEYKEPEAVALFFRGGVDCSVLCEKFKTAEGKVSPEKVWTENSINASRRSLFISYLLCFPAVALTIISVVQAIYCATQKKENP